MNVADVAYEDAKFEFTNKVGELCEKYGFCDDTKAELLESVAMKLRFESESPTPGKYHVVVPRGNPGHILKSYATNEEAQEYIRALNFECPNTQDLTVIYEW